MKKKRMVVGTDWEFDGSTIIVRIPMTWTRRGGRKVIIAPDGGDAWAPTKPRPHETLIRALARGHRWKRMLEGGKYRSGWGTGRHRGRQPQLRKPRLLRITVLAPNIQEAILDGRQPKGIQLEELARSMPSSWEKQEELVHFG